MSKNQINPYASSQWVPPEQISVNQRDAEAFVLFLWKLHRTQEYARSRDARTWMREQFSDVLDNFLGHCKNIRDLVESGQIAQETARERLFRDTEAGWILTFGTRNFTEKILFEECCREIDEQRAKKRMNRRVWIRNSTVALCALLGLGYAGKKIYDQVATPPVPAQNGSAPAGMPPTPPVTPAPSWMPSDEVQSEIILGLMATVLIGAGVTAWYCAPEIKDAFSLFINLSTAEERAYRAQQNAEKKQHNTNFTEVAKHTLRTTGGEASNTRER